MHNLVGQGLLTLTQLWAERSASEHGIVTATKNFKPGEMRTSRKEGGRKKKGNVKRGRTEREK